MITRHVGSAVVCLCLAAVQPTALRGQSASGRTVRGTVYDSLTHTPLQSAQVTLLGRGDSAAPPRTVTTSATGEYEFQNVPAGAYLIGFQHALLDSLGISATPRQLQLSSSGANPIVVPLTVPSAATIHDAFCPGRGADDSTSVLLGHVNDPSARGVVTSGLVVASWIKLTRDGHTLAIDPGRVETHIGEDGWFAVCDLPASTSVTVRASRDRDSSSAVSVRTPANRGLVRRELYVPVANHARNAAVVGRVVDAATQRPIPDAQLRVQGSTNVMSVSRAGAFTLTHLPYGATTVTVRAIGYVPQDREVDVIAGETDSVTVALAALGTVLDTMHISADRLLPDDNGFSHRRQVGWGHFFDFSEIDRMQPFETADIIRRVPGARVTTAGFTSRLVMRNTTTGRYNCQPRFFLDGAQLMGVRSTADLEMMAPADRLAGVEVYTDPASVPPEFIGAAHACGAVVMWTLPADVWGGFGH